MSKTSENQAITPVSPSGTLASAPAWYDIIRRLPTWALLPSLLAVFAFLLADIAVADPLPFLDEGALMLILVQGLRSLGERRAAARELREAEREVAAIGQPLHTT